MPQQEMIFSDYLRVIVKRKATVVFVTILVAICTYMYASRKEPLYMSTARIKIQRFQTFAQIFDEVMISSGDPLENYVHEIHGSKVLSTASAMLALKEPERPISTFEGMVIAERIPRTDLIDITVHGPNAESAKERCEAVIQAFQKIHEATISANALAEYENIQQSLESAIKELNEDEDNIRKELSNKTTTGFEKDQTELLITKLTDAQLKLHALQDTGNYTAEYPGIASLTQEINNIHEQLQNAQTQNAESETLIRNHEQKKTVLTGMITYLTQRLEEARIAITKKSERVSIVTEPSVGAMVTTAITYLTTVGALLGLMMGILLAFVAENLDASIRTLSEIEEIFQLHILGVIPHFSPHTPDVPIRPEGFWDRIKYSEAAIIWRALWKLITSEKRHANSQTAHKSNTLIVPFSSRSPATEGYRTIRTNLLLAAKNEKIGAILVTSAGPAEGKSTTIANLALAFAQAGKKTLLIGGNMRRPSLYRTFGLPRENGLSEILLGEISWHEAIKDHRDLALGEKADENLATTPGIENISFITCGGRTIQPAEWLAQPVFQTFIRECENEFDVILVDGTPILPVPDSIIMASAIGKVALVYQAGSTQRDSMLRAITLINNTGAQIAGLILNDLKASWGSTPDYYHYRGYYGRPEK